MANTWNSFLRLASKSYICGYCSQNISSDYGYYSNNKEFIYLCHRCYKPTYFDIHGEQIPGAKYGDVINDIKDESIKKLYEEAQKCVGNSSYTAAVMCCRKLLMNIAVSKGASEGLSFKEYVEYLDLKNYIPPDGKEWVEHIREKGNEANHEIKIMNQEDAKDLLDFIGGLFRFIFEFPARIKKKTLAKTVK